MPIKTTATANLFLFFVFAFPSFAQHFMSSLVAYRSFDNSAYEKNIAARFTIRSRKKNQVQSVINDDETEAKIYASVNNSNTLGDTAILVRGPYLNLATESGIIVRWRTDIPTNSKVNYGTTAGALTDSVIDSSLTTEHIVQLSGLTANTQYFYSIGSSTQTLQGDTDNYFKTFPIVGSKQKVRILVMGDMGTSSGTQQKVLTAYLDYNKNKFTDLWLLLGDNAYNAGLDSEFQNNFFNIYQTNLTKNHVMWPAPGNHDYANRKVRQQDHLISYYDIFSLPQHGEAGGVPSNTEAYYSFDYGNIHFVSLDSYGFEEGDTRLYDTTGPQATWLKQDLEANTQPWTVVFFHHPPYSKGTDSDVDSQLIKIRMKIVPILERYKVDLVLCGHSHLYERSFLINGHYGLENTFDTATMALSNSSAAYDGTNNFCPYIKNSDETRNGIVYAVVGSSGRIGGTAPGYPHNAMEFSNDENGGAMVIEIEDNRLDAKWVTSGTIIRDQFTIMKDVNKVIDTTVFAGSNITLTASWPGEHIWSNGDTTRSISANVISDTSFIVHDVLNCLKDSFHIAVTNPATLTVSANAGAIVCNGDSTTVTVTASGGTQPYTGTGTFTVTAGTYDYIVTDANGNSASASVTIDEPPALVVSSTADSIICNGDSTVVTVNAAGGTIPYNGVGNFSVAAGSYNFEVTDSSGCSASTSITVTESTAIDVSVSAGTIACYGGSTTITCNASGGAGSYLYSLNGSAYQTSNMFSNVYAGVDTITVQDENGCTASKIFEITQPDSPLQLLLVKKTNVTCKGGADGSIQFVGTGGTSPYLFKINNGAFSSNSTFSNLKAGTYKISVKDAHRCTAAKKITISDGKIICLTKTIPDVISYLAARSESTAGNNNLHTEKNYQSKEYARNESLKIKVFPNPTNKDFSLQIETNNNGAIEIVVTDIYGKKVFHKEESLPQNFSFGSNLASGMYILQVIQGKNIQTLKLIKGK